ncbi:MAG: T9SS type A sorting domain-containing protein [Melioribacteraceae bacterium]|nr:T9SS type A sorting domain-containing protein [Melioribacteraceae bacterium]WKZ69003.1 MAG: T9SS type A sorting domain-containing protein [Melioribacteraceae bacterium]
MVKLKLHVVWLLLLILTISVSAQEIVREMVTVPKADSGAITIDGLMDEPEWTNAARADLVTGTGYNIWANKYYRESLAEPEFDQLFARMLWSKDTLYVFVVIDEFVNDSTGLFFPGQWQGDQLFVSLSNRLADNMMGWYDGNVYAAPDGPYHFLIIGEDVTLNMGNESWIPDRYQRFEGDTVRSFDANDISRSAVVINEEEGIWAVEMAIYNPNVNAQGKIGFNIGGSNGSQTAFDEFEDAYQYYTWQPHIPNDPWGDPLGNGDPGFTNLANADYWAVLYFEPGDDDIIRQTMDVPMADSGAVIIDGVADEGAWGDAAHINLISGTGYNIWANKYYRESLVEPEFDEYYAKLLWSKDTLYAYIHIDEFVNDSTGLFFPGQWQGDQLFVSLSSRIGNDMMGWYDGNIYAAPDGPYHYLILGEDVTLNNGNESWIPDQYQRFEGDTVRVFDANDYSRSAVTLDFATGVMTVEMAIYNPHVASQSSVAFNLGGSNGSETAFNEFEDAYQYYTWQPHIPNDPWGDPLGNGDPGFTNLANADYWAMLNFVSTISSVGDDGGREELVNDFQLLQNYPNPFNPSTTIKFRTPKATQVSLRVYNILGQLVANLVDNKFVQMGEHTVQWNASSLASGIYFYELRADNLVQTKKMMLLK